MPRVLVGRGQQSNFNALQEAVQPEGDGNFKDLLPKIEKVCKTLGKPVIAKEVGWGFSERAARQLASVGISAIDVAGSGGTSWSEVEYHRAPTAFHARVARAFADCGSGGRLEFAAQSLLCHSGPRVRTSGFDRPEHD